MSLELILAYIAACIIFAVVPGPTVTVIVANSLAHGTRAGLLNIAGTQIGLALMIGIVALGLATIIETMSWWFDWVRYAGAAYLLWLGWKLVKTPASLEPGTAPPTPRCGFVLQGFLVVMSNPKALLLFGAFIPQFVDPHGDYLDQVLLLGVLANVVAFVSDGAYAVLFGRARVWLTEARMRLVSRISGLVLIAGAAWLALTRAR
jgi:homoserine/homoserine lactone efflux protein